jgi:diaminopimelate epimerase
MRFEKYQGLGNDFIVVDVSALRDFDTTRVGRVCDRNFGVGADGILVVSPSKLALARMTVFNSDGSRPEMCGNGLRCVALHLSKQRPDVSRFHLETDSGVLECEMQRRDGEDWIKNALGQGQTLGALRDVDSAGFVLEFDRISVGNPHAVLFDSTHNEAEIDVIGPRVSGQISGGANVEFVSQLGPRRLRVIVWERGVGRTLACGTGAGATVVAAARAGYVPFDEPVRVDLPGGSLEVTVRQSDLGVTLCGPAKHVFSGTLND